MIVRHHVLATAGHVDHGKSALVRALTGIDPDRLPEEKSRGITIDLGFAHLRIEDDDPEPGRYELGIVDVPGHEDFVKNMVAGVGSVDLALLVVAADDGWMPQTEEHLQILEYLGVQRGVVALSKSDLAPDRTETLLTDIRRRLADTALASAPVVPCSAQTGAGLDSLRRALLEVLRQTPPPRDLGKPRLAIDRAFTLKGVGTVVTGTLSGGRLERGQTVLLQPVRRVARLRGLQSYHQELEQAEPGMRVALNLADIDLRSDRDPTGAARGLVVTSTKLGEAHATVDVLLWKSPRLAAQDHPAAKPLKDGSLVRVHHGTTHTPARIRLRNAAELAPGARVLAELRFGRPVFLFAGDRFILRDSGEQYTLAGGLVLDPDADRRRWRDESQGRLLEQRAEAPEDLPLWLRTEVQRRGAVRAGGLLLKSHFAQEATQAQIESMVAAGQLVRSGNLLFDPPWWQALLKSAREAIDFEHHAHPERPGLSLARLRVALKPALVEQGIFEAVVRTLCDEDFVQQAGAIGRRGHRQALPPHLEETGRKLRAMLLARPLDPPSRKELARRRDEFEALRFLIQNQEAVPVGPELVLSQGAYRRAVRVVRRVLKTQGRATVSELRQALGCTRRLMVPLLEQLDAQGITRREGDFRVPGPRFGADPPAEPEADPPPA